MFLKSNLKYIIILFSLFKKNIFLPTKKSILFKIISLFFLNIVLLLIYLDNICLPKTHHGPYKPYILYSDV